VTDPIGNFRAVILCEDIRDEVGNKKSLMGVMTGDILVPAFPATLQIALFMEYRPSVPNELNASFEFRLLQNDLEIVKAGMSATIPAGQAANLVLPRALMTVEKEVTFRIRASVNNGPEEEIVSKRISVQAPATS
jgi:hypothetical protein